MTKRVAALGLDIGHKRIGVAGCDGTGLIATGLTTLNYTTFQKLVEQLQEIVDQRQVQLLVVGMPYSMDGSRGTQARKVEKMAYRLSKALQLPVEYADERLTSFQAEQMMLAENCAPSRNRGLVDRKAAAIILQHWLDSRRNSSISQEISHGG